VLVAAKESGCIGKWQAEKLAIAVKQRISLSEFPEASTGRFRFRLTSQAAAAIWLPGNYSLLHGARRGSVEHWAVVFLFDRHQSARPTAYLRSSRFQIVVIDFLNYVSLFISFKIFI
jgi:hypothetical protein